MPDLRSPNRFTRHMTAVELKLLREIKGITADTRRIILDKITRLGLHYSTIQDILRDIAELGRRVTETQGRYIPAIDEVVIKYLDGQLAALRIAGEPNLPTIQALQSASYIERQQIYQKTLGTEPKWIDDLARNLDLNMTRLIVAGADTTTAVNRLLASNIADGRASVLRIAEVSTATQTQSNTWVSAIMATRILFRHTERITQTVYEKQAIAAIDHNTTDCCLNVHGQIQPLDKPFILVGTPRFADKMDSPPFHWNAILAGEMCMTSKGEIPIEDVRVDDLVLTHAGRFMPVTMALSRKHAGKVLEIKTSGGIIRVTPEHPILTTVGWKNAEFLRQGDAILGCDITQSLPPVWTNAGTLNANPQDGIPERVEKLIPLDIGVGAGSMTAPVNFKAKIQFWKIKINNIFTDWFLKFKISNSNRGEQFYKSFLDFCRIVSVSIGATNRLLFCNAGHVNRIFSLHSLGCDWIGDTNTRMREPIPATIKRFLDSPSLNAGFLQAPFNNIARNAKLFSDHILGNARSVPGNNITDININSGRHNDLLPFKHYTINKIVTLELQNSMVCDLSVGGDESYCINGHYVHNCRTATSLYTERMEDKGVTTAEMVNAAHAEIKAREETGKREKIWPASSTSGRK